MIRRVLATLLVGFGVIVGGAILQPATAGAAFNPFDAACNPENPALGSGGGPACSTNTTENPFTGPQGALARVIGILAIILGVISVIFIIWGGIKYITSNGDSSAISTAKSTIIYALVGLVVAAVAQPLINFVISKL